MKLFFRIAGLFCLVTGILAEGFDLSDALGEDDPTPKPPEPPKKDDSGFDLSDALGGGGQPVTPKPAVKQPSGGGGGGGGTLSDSDLFEVGGGSYEPDGGKSSGGRALDPGYDTNSGGGEEKPQEAASPIAGIVSAIGVALVGAASSYFAYQKKKLCFKVQGGQDPEAGGAQYDPNTQQTLMTK